MSTTTLEFAQAICTQQSNEQIGGCEELLAIYKSLIVQERLNWTEHHQLDRLLGSGGQGTVFLSRRQGTDSFTLPVALKFFSPERYPDEQAYAEAMDRMAHVAALIAQIQQDNLLKVHNWVHHDGIRLMEMEWIDGYDLNRLLRPAMLEHLQKRVSRKGWDYINQVVVTDGPAQPRVKPGIAIAIIRDCLHALAALHREGIVHGDIKPSNIMIKCTGNAKIIDVGSAFELASPPKFRTCTLAYASPEVLDGEASTAGSDLCSLGYVLVEMLSGSPPFDTRTDHRSLLEAKRLLAHHLPHVLPREIASSDLLMNLCRKLIATDPSRRFPSAEAAELFQEGAASFHRQLIKGDLASEYDNDIRMWIDSLDGF